MSSCRLDATPSNFWSVLLLPCSFFLRRSHLVKASCYWVFLELATLWVSLPTALPRESHYSRIGNVTP
ncbi:hypothetical protein PIB30_005495 [Stylosanthes scabra]|uniref:Secreted protein n=1 Tax=Stylosanthes scabra TaxID=79078 RepID=A0ABU6Z610_9FABA|nr:hypothetical protein [Stylosanthes scabra]